MHSCHDMHHNWRCQPAVSTYEAIAYLFPRDIWTTFYAVSVDRCNNKSKILHIFISGFMWPSSIMLQEVMVWIYNFQAVCEVVPWSTLLIDLIVNFNTIILSRLNTNDAKCPIIIAASIFWKPWCYLKFTFWLREVDFDYFRITFIDLKNADCLSR